MHNTPWKACAVWSLVPVVIFQNIWKKHIPATSEFWNYNFLKLYLSDWERESDTWSRAALWKPWGGSYVSSHARDHCASPPGKPAPPGRPSSPRSATPAPLLRDALRPLLTPATHTPFCLKAGGREKVGLVHARIFFLGLRARLQTFE